MHIFLLIGQSNMCGRAKLEAGDEKVIADCMLWNGESWEAAKAPLNRYSTHLKPTFTQGMNCGPTFVEAYQKANPGVKVGIINWARGGSSIEEWHPDQKIDLFKDAVKQALAAQKKSGVLKGILWHQGETNFKRTALYPKQLSEHVTRLRKELKQPELPFVFGQIGQWRADYKPFNDMIVKQVAKITNTACMRTDGLTKFDPYHFDHKSQQEMGRRYAVEMLKLLAK